MDSEDGKSSYLHIINHNSDSIAHVELKVYNPAGQVLKTLVNKIKKAGSYSIKWDGKNESGNILSSGIYFVRLKIGNKLIGTGKLLILKNAKR